MNPQAPSEIFSPDRCFFGSITHGLQGNPVRHVLMAEAAGLAAPAERPMRILEIGSWIGASALTWSQAIARFAQHGGSLMCVDPWTPYMAEGDIARGGVYAAMDELGRNDLAYNLFLHNIRFAAEGVPIEHVRGRSIEALPSFEPESFDLIYIDGSHYYDDVLVDLRLAHGLLRDGGIMCGDDLELQASECDRAFADRSRTLDYVQDPATGEAFHPGVTLAVDDTFGPVTSLNGFWAMRKAASTYVGVRLRGANTLIPEHFPESVKEDCRAFIAMLHAAYQRAGA